MPAVDTALRAAMRNRGLSTRKGPWEQIDLENANFERWATEKGMNVPYVAAQADHWVAAIDDETIQLPEDVKTKIKARANARYQERIGRLHNDSKNDTVYAVLRTQAYQWAVRTFAKEYDERIAEYVALNTQVLTGGTE